MCVTQPCPCVLTLNEVNPTLSVKYNGLTGTAPPGVAVGSTHTSHKKLSIPLITSARGFWLCLWEETRRLQKSSRPQMRRFHRFCHPVLLGSSQYG